MRGTFEPPNEALSSRAEELHGWKHEGSAFIMLAGSRAVALYFKLVMTVSRTFSRSMTVSEPDTEGSEETSRARPRQRRPECRIHTRSLARTLKGPRR
jgi:hypothetical protein